MKRRNFIALLGGAAVAPALLPRATRAQQPAKIPTIGFLGTGSSWSAWAIAFVRRLRELGWIEGSTIAIEYRWAEGREERYSELVAELVNLKVDVLVTGGGALPAAKQATSSIPIVFALAADPVGSGLVASLARPGANITGMSGLSSDIAGKRLELFHELMPGARRVGVIANVAYRAAGTQIEEVKVAARILGLQVVTQEIRQADDIAPALAALKGQVDALYVLADPLANANRNRIAAEALNTRMPSMFGLKEYVEAGGLMSYGPNIPDLFRRAGDLVDKILHGSKPAELPVEQPTKFELIINLRTAKALGITVPPKLLFTADEVIE